MIGESEPGAESRTHAAASFEAERPSRSTTLAAPPPVVVTTATRGGRPSSGGLRPRTSGAISTSVSSMSTRTMPQSRK